MTIEDYCISLNPNNFFLVVLGVVDMCHDLLSTKRYVPCLTTEIVPRPAVPDGLYGPTRQHRLVYSAVADW